MLIEAKKKELLVLYTIAQKSQCTLKELADELTIPKRTIKELIRKLNTTIEQHLSISTFIFSTHKGEITISDEYQEIKMMIYHKLKLFYLRESNRFNYLLLMVNYPKAYVPKKYLLEQLYISHSYLEKLTHQLNETLQDFEIEIVSSQGCYLFKGNELFIRLYLFFILSDAFQGLEWPFDKFKLSQLKKERRLSKKLLVSKHSLKYQENLYLLIAIFTLRTQQSSLITSESSEVYAILELLQQVQDISGSFKHHLFHLLPHEIAIDELLYFNFLIYCFFPNLISSQQKSLIGYTLTNKRNHLCMKITSLTKELAQTFPVIAASEKRFFYNYYLMLSLISILILGNTTPFFYSLHFPKPALELDESNEQIQQIQQIISEVFHDHPKKTLIIYYLSSLIYNLLQSETNEKLLIYVQMNKTLTGNYHIQNRLRQVFDEKMIRLTENPEQADLIVTDWFDKLHQTSKIFYLDPSKEKDLWVDLVTKIQQLYVNKMI